MLTVGDQFPAFKTRACNGVTPNDLADVSNETYAGKWNVFIFYPKDFTFVCPTELVEFSRQIKQFTDRDALVIGASTDNEYSHLAWRQQHNDLKTLTYPLVAAQKLAVDLGILEVDAGVCLRATFIVDPNGVIQWVCANNLNVGRSVAEVLRVLDAIQSDELCPCNWQKGQPTLKV